jgi:phosphohistidine phosphatase SixA
MLRLAIAPVFTMALPAVDAQGLKDNAKTLHTDVIQSPKPEAHRQRIDAKLDKRALIHALQKGGYVLYLRHAITDRSRIDADRVNLHNCATQRNLSEEGRKQAQAIGKAVRTLGITVAEVLTSPYCRCIDTAKLAFGKFTVMADLVWTLGQPETETQRLAKALRKLLGTQPPKGANTVLVSHTANLKEAVGIWPEPEGAVYVFLPREDGGVSHLGSIGPEEWTTLTQTEK